MDYIIGIDIGTTSTKTIAFDLYGHPITKKIIGYPVINDSPTYSEQDPKQIFQAVIDSLAYVTLRNQKDNLQGIGFSCAMHSLISVNEDNVPLTQCMIWADIRSQVEAEQIRVAMGQAIYKRTGTPVHPMLPLCKIAWLKNNLPNIFKKTYKFISIKEYVLFELFGEYVIDYSLASATGLLNNKTLKWDEKALNFLEISRNQLSELVDVTYTLKQLKKVYQDKFNLKHNIPFIIGASDGCLAHLGVGAMKKDNLSITLGTSGAIRVLSKEPFIDEKKRVFSYVLSKDYYVVGGAVNNGGILLKWFIDLFSIDLSYESIFNNVIDTDIGADGLVFLPYLLGERAPHWDAHARGVYFGININHTKKHFLRAMLEGISYGLYSIYKIIDAMTESINCLYATGGFVKSDIWLQMVADIFNKKLIITECQENACLGAAITVLKTINKITSLEESVNMVTVSKIFYPNVENHQKYMRFFALYERLYDKLKEEFYLLSKEV